MKTARHYQRIVSTGLVLVLVGLFLTLNLVRRAGASTYLLPHSLSPSNQEFPIVQGPDDLLRPAIANGDLMIWYAQGGDGLDVFGLRLDNDGRSQGEPLLIGGGPGDQAVPSIASSTEGGNYLVVWHSQRSSDADSDIYARHLDAEGRPQGDSFAICIAEGDQLRPAVAYAPDANIFVVAWQDNRMGNVDLYARLVPVADGSAPALAKEFVVSSVSSDQLIPSVACETEGPHCLVVWMDNRNNSFFYTDIMGRLVNAASGDAIGDKIDVAVERWYQDSPAAVYNPVSAEYMVVWNDDISCRRVSRDGQPLGAKVEVSLESPFQYKPVVAIDADGKYLIVWEDGRNQDSHGTDIYGQWLSSAGVPMGINFALSTDSHNQYWPALAFDQNTGAFFAVWEDDRNNGNLALYGQMLSDVSETQ
ncbi:MAG: hypothetical protein ISS49_12160 [Anaerolineae bacterium]|nr:hypothetical protein [Anaerolineae bacterium]